MLARAASLPLWQLRGLQHELGTIDLFDHAGVDRLTRARDIAAEVGALSTLAVIEVQLAAAHLFRFASTEVITTCPVGACRSPTAAIGDAAGYRSGLHRRSARPACRHRRDGAAQQPCHGSCTGRRGDHRLGWGGRAVAALSSTTVPGATAFEQVPCGPRPARQCGASDLPRALAALLVVEGDARADESPRRFAKVARRSTVPTAACSAGLQPCWQVAPVQHTAGRGAGRRAAADLANFPVWAELGSALAAEAALADGWGEPRRWLAVAAEAFDAHSLPLAAERARVLQAVRVE